MYTLRNSIIYSFLRSILKISLFMNIKKKPSTKSKYLKPPQWNHWSPFLINTCKTVLECTSLNKSLNTANHQASPYPDIGFRSSWWYRRKGRLKKTMTGRHSWTPSRFRSHNCTWVDNMGFQASHTVPQHLATLIKHSYASILDPYHPVDENAKTNLLSGCKIKVAIHEYED